MDSQRLPELHLGDVNGAIATGSVYYSPGLTYDSDTSGQSADPMWEVADALAENNLLNDVANPDGTVKSTPEIVQALEDYIGYDFDA